MSPSARESVGAASCTPRALPTDAKNEYDTAEASDDEGTTYPDGGLQAWLVVLGSFCGMYVTIQPS
jgi:hypothetical protein